MIVKVYDKLTPGIKAIRLQVFVEEQSFVNEFDEIDDRAHHLVMYHDKVAIATCRVYYDPSEKSWHVGRIAVIQPWRKNRIGTRILKCAIEYARGLGAARLYLSAQVRVQGFYEQLGFTILGDSYLDEDVPHVLMVKELSDQ